MLGNLERGEIFTNIFDIDSDNPPSCDRVQGHAVGVRQIEAQRAAVLIVRDEWFTIFVVYESQLIRSEREISGKDLSQNPASHNKPITICGATKSHGPLVLILRKKRRQFRFHVRRLIERRHPNMRLIRAEFIVAGSTAPFVNLRVGGDDHIILALQRCPPHGSYSCYKPSKHLSLQKDRPRTVVVKMTPGRGLDRDRSSTRQVGLPSERILSHLLISRRRSNGGSM